MKNTGFSEKKKKELKYCPWNNHKIHCGDEPLVFDRQVWVCKVPPLSIYRTSKFESMCSLEHFLAPFVQGSLIGLSFSLISGLYLGLECLHGTSSLKWNPNIQAANAPGTCLLCSPGDKDVSSSELPFHGGLSKYVLGKFILLCKHLVTHKWSQLPRFKQATAYPSCLATIKVHKTILIFLSVCVLAGSWAWILHSCGHEDPTTLILFSYGEICNQTLDQRERERFNLQGGICKPLDF